MMVHFFFNFIANKFIKILIFNSIGGTHCCNTDGCNNSNILKFNFYFSILITNIALLINTE